MEGASRTSPSQPLLTFAPKTASGGKIRARRFASEKRVAKPLDRLRKIRLRSQPRVGVPILAKTIGNLVADRISRGPRLAYEDVGTDDGVSGGGGAGDAPAVQSVASDGEIVVTASRRSTPEQRAAAAAAIDAAVAAQDAADAAAPVASINRGSDPYPGAPEDMSGNTEWQLQKKYAAYLGFEATLAKTPTDHALNVKAFEDLIAQAHVREAPGVAAANAATTELLRAGLVPFDIAAGGYNIATGNGELRDYLAVASVVPVGKVLGAVGVAARIEVKGFASFSALKRYLGSPGTGNQWHHIVEQTPGNLKTFGADVIHSTDNVVAIPATTHLGKGSISAYYSSKDFFTNGQTVRQWLSTQSFQAQRQFGLDTLKRYGQ